MGGMGAWLQGQHWPLRREDPRRSGARAAAAAAAACDKGGRRPYPTALSTCDLERGAPTNVGASTEKAHAGVETSA